MPEKVKRTTLTQETIRILRNCHPDLPWEQKIVHLNDLTERMRESGYKEKMRKEVIESGLKGYEKMLDVERNGGRPVNRLRSMEQTERKKEKMRKRAGWHKKGDYDTVLFVPCTPGGILAKRMKEVEERGRDDRGWKVRIVEMWGQTLKQQLCRSDPWTGKPCGHPQCFACKEEKGGNCRRKNVGYAITCKECKATYHGETSRTMFCRGREHMKSFEQRKRESVLWEHCQLVHEGRDVGFKMKAAGYYKEPLTRQVNEAVRIFNGPNTMNRKNEWRKTAVPRAIFEKQ